MRLPNAEAASVSDDKVVGYLLNRQHPDGAGKAKFFASLGFRVHQWQALAAALKALAERSSVTFNVETEHGQKYIVEGTIETPSGRRPTVRTVWIVDRGESVPRLVTAYPCEQET